MPWVILAASLLVLAVLSLVSWFLWKVVRNLVTEKSETQYSLMSSLKESQQGLISSLTAQQDLTRDLLNRMMSKDLQAYATMSALTNSSKISDEPYIGRSDEEEAERLASFAGIVPVGDTVFTENDVAEGFIGEIGLSDLTNLAGNLAEQDG
jgi:hypothetical protein